MAIFTPGPLTGAISGDVAGVNFAHSRAGRYVRSRLHRVDHDTHAQGDQRALFQSAHAAWLALTVLQRRAWAAAAANSPLPNRLAVPRYLSGWQLFLRIKTTAGSSFLDPIVTPPQMSISPQPYNLALVVDVSAGYTLSWDPSTAPANYSAVLFGARPVSSSPRTHFNSWRFLGTKAPATDPWTFTTLWNSTLGAPVAGEIVAVKLRIWQLDHLPSPLTLATTTVIP